MAPEPEVIAQTVKVALEATKAATIADGKSAVYIGEPRDEDRPLPRHYQVVHVTSGSGGGYRLAGPRSGDKVRITVRNVGKTYGEASWETQRSKEALDDKVFTVSGYDWQQNEDDAERPIAPDNDIAPSEYDGVRVWSTVLTPLSV